MTITRLVTNPLSIGSINGTWTSVSTTPPLGNTAPYIQGLYILQFGTIYEGIYTTLGSAISQARSSVIFFIAPSGAFSGTPSVITFGSGGLGTKVFRLYWDSGTWRVYAGATELGSWADTNRRKIAWFQIGIDFNCHASTGWCYVYFDGVAKLSYTGKTDYGASDFDTICVGPDTAGDNWRNYTQMYGFYLDDTSGEAAPAVPPLSIFKSLIPNGNGNYSEWVGSDGNSTNNYALVDDTNQTTLSNTMTDYVQGNTANDQDSYAMENNADQDMLTSASVIYAVRHCATALEQAGATEQYRPFFRYSGTDLTGTAVNLSTSVGVYREVFSTAPGGGAWTYAILDAVELGVEIL